MKKIIFALLFLLSLPAMAKWPQRDITIIVPYLAGGVTDQFARAIQTDLEEQLKVSVLIRYMPGAANMVAINHVLSGPNDNHTFIYTIDDFISGPMLQNQRSYEKFRGVSITSSVPYLAFAAPGVTSDQLKTAVAKKQMVNIGVAGGSGVWIKSLTPGEIFNVAYYKGTPPLLTDVSGGHTTYGVISSTGSFELIQSGKLVPIMILGNQRHPAFRHIPTHRELGFVGETSENWFGLVTRHDTTDEAVNTFATAVQKSVKNNTVIKSFQKRGMTVINTDAAGADRYLQENIRKFEKLKISDNK